ncbi:hypothetical protein [Paenibacillus sp. FSL R10-2734]|uniref:hypothetical protein n=1 Tax=Paenibacillus sp. FSL R10-2734 TaxID=2954691 RepID=UPI0030D958BC
MKDQAEESEEFKEFGKSARAEEFDAAEQGTWGDLQAKGGIADSRSAFQLTLHI